MNFLAHLYLSFDNEPMLMGNFLADMVTNKEVSGLPEDMQKGIQLHRHIDMYTDSHAEIKKGIVRIRPIHRKYAPVVVDIYYDYLLANNWKKVHHLSLDDFSQQCYSTIEKHMSSVPKRLQPKIENMIKGDWLVKYGLKDGLRYTFSRIVKRAKFASNLATAAEDLFDNEPAFQAEFDVFFPDLSQYSKKVMEELW